MIHDGTNNLDISYNHLNLTEKVEQNGSTLANYSYLADGTKLSATDADGNGLYYLGSLVYSVQNGAFAFCAGNPIKFVDPNGRKIVDAQGNLLYHDGKWTDAAQGTAAMVIGNAIMRTNMGRILWNRLSDAEYGITIELNPGMGKINEELGLTKTKRRDDNGEITSVKITIYEGSIAKQIEPQYTGKRAQRLRSLSEEDRIGMVGVHEATHAIDDTPSSNTNQREANATAAEIQHVQELNLRKSIIKEDWNLFDTNIIIKRL